MWSMLLSIISNSKLVKIVVGFVLLLVVVFGCVYKYHSMSTEIISLNAQVQLLSSTVELRTKERDASIEDQKVLQANIETLKKGAEELQKDCAERITRVSKTKTIISNAKVVKPESVKGGVIDEESNRAVIRSLNAIGK